jgi:hypothetical protein
MVEVEIVITLPDNISARQLELAKRGNLKALGIKGKEANTQSVTNRLNYLFYGENKGRGKLKFNNINEVKNLIRKRRKDIIGNQKESYLKYVKDVKKHNNLFSSDSIMRQKINSYNQYKKQNLSIEKSMQNKNMKDQRDKITDVTQKVPGEKYYYYSRNNNNVINLTT